MSRSKIQNRTRSELVIVPTGFSNRPLRFDPFGKPGDTLTVDDAVIRTREIVFHLNRKDILIAAIPEPAKVSPVAAQPVAPAPAEAPEAKKFGKFKANTAPLPETAVTPESKDE